MDDAGDLRLSFIYYLLLTKENKIKRNKRRLI